MLIRPASLLKLSATILILFMIPVIAFFGTGKPAAVVTTMIFGGTPVVRLTVLGDTEFDELSTIDVSSWAALGGAVEEDREVPEIF